MNTTHQTVYVSRNRDRRVLDARPHRNDPIAAIARVTLGIAVVVGLACSSATPAPEQWTATYVEPPDRVWVAIAQTLEALGYDIEETDRHNSIVVARSGGDESDPAVGLRVAQVARTEVVRVHVTPHGDTADDDRFRAAASEFLAALEATMQGVPRTEESSES